MASSTSFEMPKAASEGFKDGKAYDAHRPSYLPEAVQALVEKLKVAGKPGARIIEVGSGTGKFTEVLARRPENFEIVAIEPLDSMRKQLEDKNLDGVKVLDGQATLLPVEGAWGDACIVAQAFHWFATDEALDEMARVLKPMAVLGLVWNIEDYNKPMSWPASTQWEQKLSDFVHALPEDGHLRFRHSKWQEVFTRQLSNNPIRALRDGMADHLPRFSLPIGEQRIPFTVWLEKDAMWKRINTLSQVAVLKDAQKDEARRTFDQALEGPDVERNDKGEIALHGITYLAWTDKIGGGY
ncbi:hypothetical protein RB597_004480 [Gaeumannomyces tritici]